MAEADFPVTLEGVSGLPVVVKDMLARLKSVCTWVDENQRALSEVASDGNVEVEDSRHIFRNMAVEGGSCGVVWVGLVDRHDEVGEFERSREVGLAVWNDVSSPGTLWEGIPSRNQEGNDSKPQHFEIGCKLVCELRNWISQTGARKASYNLRNNISRKIGVHVIFISRPILIELIFGPNGIENILDTRFLDHSCVLDNVGLVQQQLTDLLRPYGMPRNLPVAKWFSKVQSWRRVRAIPSFFHGGKDVFLIPVRENKMILISLLR